MAGELFLAGEPLTASKLNRITGAGAATSLVPTLVQSAAVPKTVEYAAYNRRGDYVFYDFSLAVSGAGGVAANVIRVGLPPYVPIPFRFLGGAAAVFDASAAIWYAGAPVYGTTTAISIQYGGYASPLGLAGMTAALASGDVVCGSVWYRTSS